MNQHTGQEKVGVAGEQPIAADINGVRYWVTGDDRFRMVTLSGATHFADPQGFWDAAIRCVNSGIIKTLAQARSILGDYELADRKRQTPVVAFDDNGSIAGITCVGGYGAGEYTAAILPGGDTHRVQVGAAEEDRAIAEMQGLTSMYPAADYPLSSGQAWDIIHRARHDLNPELGDAVFAWFSRIDATVTQRYEAFREAQIAALGNAAMGQAAR